MNYPEYLDVKRRTLIAEGRIIAQKERAAIRQARYLRGRDDVLSHREYDLYHGLHHHKVRVVRPEARHTNLACGFLRGRPYRVMEQKTRSDPNWDAVQKMVERYGEGDKRDLVQRFTEWKDAA